MHPRRSLCRPRPKIIALWNMHMIVLQGVVTGFVHDAERTRVRPKSSGTRPSSSSSAHVQAKTVIGASSPSASGSKYTYTAVCLYSGTMVNPG